MSTACPAPVHALLVDDDRAGAELTAAVLRRMHPQLVIAIVHDGQEALDYLHRQGAHAGRPLQGPSVVFLDLNMPRLDGHEVLRHIRHAPGLGDLRVVILTSSDRPADMAHSSELGADAHVIKPVAIEELIRRLRAVAHLWTRTPALP